MADRARGWPIAREGLPFLAAAAAPGIAAWVLGWTVAGSLFGDRKSTRLNSSHGYISYAVFCLKKKKKQNYQHKLRAGRMFWRVQAVGLLSIYIVNVRAT